jgi:hypothetical protein
MDLSRAIYAYMLAAKLKTNDPELSDIFVKKNPTYFPNKSDTLYEKGQKQKQKNKEQVEDFQESLFNKKKEILDRRKKQKETENKKNLLQNMPSLVPIQEVPVYNPGTYNPGTYNPGTYNPGTSSLRQGPVTINTRDTRDTRDTYGLYNDINTQQFDHRGPVSVHGPVPVHIPRVNPQVQQGPRPEGPGPEGPTITIGASKGPVLKTFLKNKNIKNKF